MRDPRNARLADVIVHHSTALQPGEAVLIESFDVADGLVLDLVEARPARRRHPAGLAAQQRRQSAPLIRGGSEDAVPAAGARSSCSR